MKLRNHPVLITLGIITSIAWLIGKTIVALIRATIWLATRNRGRCRVCRGRGIVHYRGRSVSGYRPCHACQMKGVTR